MSTTPRGLLARLLRLDRRHRDRWRVSELDNHLRQDIGLAPHDPPPRNPFTQGW